MLFAIVVFACVLGYFVAGVNGALIAGVATGVGLFRYKLRLEEAQERNASLSPALMKLIEDKRLAETGSDASRIRRQYRDTSPTPKMSMPTMNRLRKSLAPMLVQLMKIDDQELDVEANVIDQFLFLLGFSPQDATLMRSRMGQLSKHAFDPYQLARELTVFTVEERTLLMEGLYRVTFADGIFHPNEEAYLRQVAAVLELDETFYVLQSSAGRARVHQGFGERGHYSEEDAKLVLGLLPEASQSEVKQRYKELRWFYRTLVFPNLESNLSRLRDRALREIHKAWQVFEVELEEGEVPATTPTPLRPQGQPVAELRPAIKVSELAENDALPVATKPMTAVAAPSPVIREESTLDDTPTNNKEAAEEIAAESRPPEFSKASIEELFETFRDFNREASEKAVEKLATLGESAEPYFLAYVDELLMRDWLEKYLLARKESCLGLVEKALQSEGRNRDWLLASVAEAAGRSAQPLLVRYLTHDSFLYQNTAERALGKLGFSMDEIQKMKESP